MEQYFGIISDIIEDVLKDKEEIAFFPMGMLGTFAKYICETRYGRKGIYVDNKICSYNEDVYSLEQFVKKYANKKVTVILCVVKRDISLQLKKQLVGAGFNGKVRNCLEKRIHMYPDKEDSYSRIKDLCRVKKAVDYDFVRIGGAKDGGYVMLNDFASDYTAYSFGIGNNVVWDLDMAAKGVDVHCYDPFIDRLPVEDFRLHFHKFGISGCDDYENGMLSMKTALENNKESNNNLLLKMDVEGAEWDFFLETESEILAKFRQMTFELHNLTDENNLDCVIKSLSKIRKTHTPIWIHANNNGNLNRGTDTVLPSLLEITFARDDSYELIDTQYDCPIELDYPNVDRFIEVTLKDFGTIHC